KQPSLLFAQGQLLQALRPQDFQKEWREEGRMSCTLAASCREERLRSPSGGLCGGRPARVKHCGWGSRRKGAAGRAAAVGGAALNRGPQLGLHNDISGGQAEPSAVQMGKLRRRPLQSLRREGPAISYSGSFIFPQEGTTAQELECLVSGHSVFRLRHRSRELPGHLAAQTPPLLTN
ncbi:hypothetical protein DBR06_SOUSAS310282, partial [Sousa chinensis]